MIFLKENIKSNIPSADDRLCDLRQPQEVRLSVCVVLVVGRLRGGRGADPAGHGLRAVAGLAARAERRRRWRRRHVRSAARAAPEAAARLPLRDGQPRRAARVHARRSARFE